MCVMIVQLYWFANRRPQAYVGPDGKPRLFRPEKNMARLARSAERVALPVSPPLKSAMKSATDSGSWISHSTRTLSWN